MNQLLDASGVSFSWGENDVLKELNLQIKENELVSILGVNGAGKSTLLKCLNRILKPKSGEIRVFSENIHDLNLIELSKFMSYVPQSVRSSFSMDVFDVILLGRRPHINWSISNEDRDKVSNTIRFLNLEDFAFRRFNQLSGGERQKISIARALIKQPKILLLDEATSALDNKSESKVNNVIKSFKRNITIIIVAHRLSTILEAKRIIYV